MSRRNSAGQDSATTELDELLRRSRNIRQRFERHWALQLAYYQGRQWVFVDSSGRLSDVQLDPWQIKLVDNRIQPVVRTEVAKMTKNRPAFVAVPRTGDEADSDSARVAELILRFLWTELDLTRKQRNALLWSRVCGAGFWKTYWDAQRGDSVEVFTGPEGKVLIDAAGRPMRTNRQDVAQVLESLPDELRGSVGTRKIAVGDACVEVRTPWEIFPDDQAGEEGLESAEWIVEESVRSPQYLRERYDVDLEPDARSSAGIAESRMPGIAGSDEAEKSGVRVRELWMKPSSSEARGKRVVWAQGRVLHEDANPYPWLPYVMFRGVPVPGRFWPTSVTEQLISPQTELNKRKAQIAENAARIGNPPLLESRQANVEWNGLPGERVLFDDTLPNAIPHFLQVPEMPGYIREDIGRIEQSIQEISGQHEVTGGSVPTGVTAASAINLLQEADDTRLGPDVQDMEVALAQAGERLLELVAHYYTDQRTVRIAGADQAWEVFDFRGAMLRGNTHVEVQAGSAMPRSKAAKQAAMTELMQLVIQYGVQVDPRDLRKFFADYEVGGLERLFATLSEDEQQVNRENRRLALGDAGVTVNAYDSHEFHIAAHREFQKSQRYEGLSPTVKALIEGHVAAHMQATAPPPAPPQVTPVAPTQNPPVTPLQSA